MGNFAQIHIKGFDMFNLTGELQMSGSRALSIQQLSRTVPAAFAERAFAHTSPSYVFISTSQLLEALMESGFAPVRAQQASARGERRGYARHMIRFRHIHESVTVVDAVPEIILINAHDATSAYELRAGLYRPICANGLISRIADFGVIRVPHRGNVIANVVEGAVQLTRGFAGIGATIEQMARTVLDQDRRQRFADAALAIRYREGQHAPFSAGRLLEARRDEDRGHDVWATYNVLQENLIRGGIAGVSARGRASRSRPIRAIREDVRINAALWQQAMDLIRA